MNAQEIIDYIANSEKKTPVKIYVNLTEEVDFGSAKVYGTRLSQTVFGDWEELRPILEASADKIVDMVVENDRRNSGVPLLDLKGVKARIEPGAIIREKVEIGEGAVIAAGSIVTRDIPPRVVAGGNPCRVIRPLTEADREKWEAALREHRGA